MSEGVASKGKGQPGKQGQTGAATRGPSAGRRAVETSGLGVRIIAYTDVENPSFTEAKRENSENPRNIRVARNLNESPLLLLFERRTIDEAQALAGHKLRALVERLEQGGKSASFLRERVDRSGRPDMFGDTRLDAVRRLEAAATAIGPDRYRIARAVCAEGVSLNQLAKMNRTRQETAKVALKDALDALAKHWGLVNAARHAPR